MPSFSYRIIDAAGRRRRGTSAAHDAPTLQRQLESTGATVLEVRDADDAATPHRRLRPSDVEDAMRAIATLLPAGLPLAAALDAAAESAPAAVASALRDVRARIERGEPIATALAAQPGLLSAATVGIVRAGERAGDLDGAFARAAAQLERQGALRQRLISAAIYPSLLAVAGIGALCVLVLFVLPRFADLLGGAGLPVPRSTALLLHAAALARAYWVVFPLLALTLVAAALWARWHPAGRRVWSRALLALPVVSHFRRALLAAEAARLTSVLLHGGASLLSALDDTIESVRDPEARDALARVRERVRAGAALHAALEPETVFPPLLAALVRTGEAAGRLHSFLDRSAVLFEQRTERDAQRLVTLAEPAMIVVFGVLVGAVALSLLQAIYGVNPAALR